MSSSKVPWDQGEPVYRRDGWTCQYCGLDGTASFANWLALTWDHLLPKDDPCREDEEYIVTACMSCNVLLSHYFQYARSEGKNAAGQSRDRLLTDRRRYLKPKRREYFEYWLSNVAPATPLMTEYNQQES